MKSLGNALLCSLVLAAAEPTAACPGLDVQDGWIRATPPGAMMTAAYAKLANRGDRPLVIDGGFGADFTGAELHQTRIEKGVYQMGTDVLSIAPGESRALEPGGWHLMLFRPRSPLQPGAQVKLALTCGGQAREATFIVRAPE